MVLPFSFVLFCMPCFQWEPHHGLVPRKKNQATIVALRASYSFFWPYFSKVCWARITRKIRMSLVNTGFRSCSNASSQIEPIFRNTSDPFQKTNSLGSCPHATAIIAKIFVYTRICAPVIPWSVSAQRGFFTFSFRYYSEHDKLKSFAL